MALQLMRAGYSRVSVVRGGLPAMMDAGVAVAPKDVKPLTVLPSMPHVGNPRGAKDVRQMP